jgi:YHS domain-containing protein
MVLLTLLLAADPTDAVAGLRPLGPLVGDWKGTGTPDGPKTDANKFWTETVSWQWQFDKADPRLVGTVANGKHFTSLVLRYKAADKTVGLTAATTDKKELVFAGTLTVGKQGEQVLTVERTDADTRETHRLVLTLLHANRYLYRHDVKPAGATAFARKYQVGVTKQGESFADVAKGPECVVSGGQAKIPVVYKGTTYYVCCTGCKDAFLADPGKYVKK